MRVAHAHVSSRTVDRRFGSQPRSIAAEVAFEVQPAADMQTVWLTLLSLSLTGCMDDDGYATPLSYDAYFIAVFAPHTSAEDCIASSPDPRGCQFATTLCKDGRAASRMGDIISIGTYEMLGSVAHATLTSGETFEFDVSTPAKAGDSANTTWNADTTNLHLTEQFDTIDCSAL